MHLEEALRRDLRTLQSEDAPGADIDTSGYGLHGELHDHEALVLWLRSCARGAGPEGIEGAPAGLLTIGSTDQHADNVGYIVGE
jgi:hypothetical protein